MASSRCFHGRFSRPRAPRRRASSAPVLTLVRLRAGATGARARGRAVIGIHAEESAASTGTSKVAERVVEAEEAAAAGAARMAAARGVLAHERAIAAAT